MREPPGAKQSVTRLPALIGEPESCFPGLITPAREFARLENKDGWRKVLTSSLSSGIWSDLWFLLAESSRLEV